MSTAEIDPRLRRVMDAIVLVATVVLIAVGAWTLAFPARQGDAYLAAPECSSPLDALTHPCYSKFPATVTSRTTLHRFLGQVVPQVTLYAPMLSADRFTITIAQPPPAYYALSTGSVTSVKVWDGIVTAVYDVHGTGMRTDASPLTRQDTQAWGAFALLGVGLILLIVHPPVWLAPAAVRRRAPRFRPNWHTRSVQELFADPPQRIAIVVLMALNLLDIASSLIGERVGTYEGNPVAAQMVAQWGPLGGFFSLKLPAMLAILLAITKLPRRVAIGLTYVACIVMVFVVGSNIVLIDSPR